MNCGEIDQLLDHGLAEPEWPGYAREHVADCPRCRTLLEGMAAMDFGVEPDPAFTARIAADVVSGMKPVQPLPPVPVEAAVLALLAACLGALLAATTGWKGWAGMNGTQRSVIYAATAAALAALAAAVSLEMEPGRVRPRVLRALCWAVPPAALLVVSSLLGWSPGDDFALHAALCFTRGLCTAAVILAGAWVLARRGYYVAHGRAGAAIGLLAGLGGFLSQELYCPLVFVPHTALAHVGLLVFSTVAGFMIGRQAGLRRGPAADARTRSSAR